MIEKNQRLWEKSEHTKEAIRRHNSKKGGKKKEKQRSKKTTYKTKDLLVWTPQRAGMTLVFAYYDLSTHYSAVRDRTMWHNVHLGTSLNKKKSVFISVCTSIVLDLVLETQPIRSPFPVYIIFCFGCFFSISTTIVLITLMTLYVTPVSQWSKYCLNYGSAPSVVDYLSRFWLCSL
jgi:hypothetical protein